MESRITGTANRPHFVSDGFVEATWELMITLGTTAAICVGVISLAAHLNETGAARAAAEAGAIMRDAGTSGLHAGIAGIGAHETSRLN